MIKYRSIKLFGLSLVIIITTLTVTTTSVKKIWFREDDLGQIINGLLGIKTSLIKLFTTDERDNVVPSNYRRSTPNFVSGFLRPIKHLFFTLIYKIYGLDPRAFFVLHAFIHSINAALFFYLLSGWITLWLAFLGGFLCAFYPDISWLVWLATLHNSLAMLFLFISLLCYQRYFSVASGQQKITGWSTLIWYLLSSIFFLFSLLTRENGIFYPAWIMAGVILFYHMKGLGFRSLVSRAFRDTGLLAFIVLVYTGMKLYAFGTHSLTRTVHNLVLRFPFLTRIFGKYAVQKIEAVNAATFKPALSPIATFLFRFESFMWAKIWVPLKTWLKVLFSVETNKVSILIIITALVAFFLIRAYRKHGPLLAFLLIGGFCFAWPGILAYPSARYINMVYPLLAAMVVMGLHLLKYGELADQKDSSRVGLIVTWSSMSLLLYYVMVLLCCYAIVQGAYRNTNAIRQGGQMSASLKQRYKTFFKHNSFPADSTFVVLSSPFVSDIENVFQYFLGDLKVSVAHELFTTLAEQGSFGCKHPYRVQGVSTSLIPADGGFRFISHDPAQSAWTLNFSDHPLQWIPDERSYRWTDQSYQKGLWYECSLGSFSILDMNEEQFITDMVLKIDERWIAKNTVFVAWDTMQGGYKILPADHLKI